MNIEWTLCSERMPPLNVVTIIRDGRHTKFSAVLSVSEAKKFGIGENDEWTRFTQEKWEFLNK